MKDKVETDEVGTGKSLDASTRKGDAKPPARTRRQQKTSSALGHVAADSFPVIVLASRPPASWFPPVSIG